MLYKCKGFAVLSLTDVCLILKHFGGCLCRIQRRPRLLVDLWWSKVFTWTMETSVLYNDWYRDACEFSFLTACFFLFFSHPQSEGWPHHERTFSIYLCSLSFWLTLPQKVLSMYWCCPSRPCVVFLACVHLTLFLALSLSAGNSLISLWYGVTTIVC